VTEESKLSVMSSAFYDVASVVGQQQGTDPIETAMALAHAATRMLFIYAPDDNARMRAADIMAKSGLKAMADMIAGQDAEHQAVQ
jgi:hypothetical protein